MPAIRRKPSTAIVRTRLGLCVRSDLATFQLTGEHAGVFVEHLAPLLDGTRDREALSKALRGYSPASVASLLDLLEARGLIEAVPDAGERRRGQEEFFRAWSKAPKELARRLAEARVLVVGEAPWCKDLATALEAAGVGAVQRASGDAAEIEAEGATAWSLLVAAVAPEDLERVERIARFAHRAGLVSLWGHVAGTTAFFGPVVTPGQTACRLCATAEAVNPRFVARAEAPAGPRRDAGERLVAHHVAMEALKVISGYTRSTLGGRLLIQDLGTLETSRHALVRLPWCRVCGEEPGIGTAGASPASETPAVR